MLLVQHQSVLPIGWSGIPKAKAGRVKAVKGKKDLFEGPYFASISPFRLNRQLWHQATVARHLCTVKRFKENKIEMDKCDGLKRVCRSGKLVKFLK
jgi:hypothetical protein